MKTILCILLTAIIILPGCKKSRPDTPLKSSKAVTAFAFTAAGNPGILAATFNGRITADSITVKLPEGTPLTRLLPSVTHTGSSISPTTAQDFSLPVRYTVTAEDGTQKTYVVAVSYASTQKEITSFTLRAADNPALTEDVTGQISGDSITLWFDTPVGLTSLKLHITYRGERLSPPGGVAQDFTNPFHLTVTAEDGSTRQYTVVAGSQTVVYVGSQDGNLYALNAFNGQLKWQYTTAQGITSSPAYDKGTLYVGGNDGYLHALDAATGQLKWKYWANGPRILYSPAIRDNTVYVTCYSNDYYYHPGIHAVDAATGQLKWKYDVDYATDPALGPGLVYSGSFGAGLSAVDAATGTLRWRYNSGITKARPTIVNGILYAGGEYPKLFALDAATGKELWKVAEQFGGSSSPTIANGKLYVGIGGHLYSYDAATGAQNWKFVSNGLRMTTGSGSFSSPVYSNGIVFAGNNDSYFYAVDAATGTLKWQFGDAVRTGLGAPNATVAGSVVYVGSYQHDVYALEAATGRTIWKFTTNGPVYSGPCVVDSKQRATHAGNSGNQQ